MPADEDVTTPAADPTDASTPALAVAVVARRLGVAPATLRTWDRRYGLGPSEHSAGAHRRYGAHDVERLLVMRRLTLDGVAPGEAARIALATDVSAAVDSPGAPALGHARPLAPHPDATPTAVVDSALAGDEVRCARLLVLGDLTSAGVARWWTDLVEPALTQLARRTVVDRPGVDAALTVRGAASAALRDATARPPAAGSPVVLVLVPPGEERPLVAHALAAALVGHGVDGRLVGGPVGTRHAAELVAMTRARAVVTVGRRPDPDLAVVASLARERPDLAQFVMLPETAHQHVPVERHVHRARTFTGLLHEVLAVAAGDTA